ncbi:MAG: tryptophan synthase subunit alpha [Planctomycetota bacterium]
MSAIDDLFQQMRAEQRKAFMPFVTAGDPDLDATRDVLMRLQTEGCHLVELGIPYSDPIADGPVIQASYTRALGNEIKLEQIFATVKSLKTEITMPIVMMVSYAIIYRYGMDAFLDSATQAGVSGAIVPDMPYDEAEEFAKHCRNHDFSLIPLITPTTPKERAIEIAKSATGFIYYVSITGITGERTALPEDLVDNLKWLREQTELPICVGFGISSPEQVELLKPHCDGIIVGSAIVRRIAAASEGSPINEVVDDVGKFASEMVNAM